MAQTPLINYGQRATIAGRSGSGKSTLGRFLLQSSPGYWVILNPKHTKAYNALPGAVTVSGIDFGKIDAAMRKSRFVIVNPKLEETTPDYLDAFIYDFHTMYERLGLCIDELYSIHKSGVAGAGYTALLTRGRELKQSYLGLTQRPAFISKFAFSESNFIGVMALNLDEDRKRMYEVTGQPIVREKLEPHHWYWYATEADTLRHLGPVPMK